MIVPAVSELLTMKFMTSNKNVLFPAPSIPWEKNPMKELSFSQCFQWAFLSWDISPCLHGVYLKKDRIKTFLCHAHQSQIFKESTKLRFGPKLNLYQSAHIYKASLWVTSLQKITLLDKLIQFERWTQTKLMEDFSQCTDSVYYNDILSTFT